MNVAIDVSVKSYRRIGETRVLKVLQFCKDHHSKFAKLLMIGDTHEQRIEHARQRGGAAHA